MRNAIGQRFGRLVAISQHGKYVACICDCGQNKSVRVDHLFTGRTRSCGCLGRELRTRHGGSKTLEYRSWRGMMRRCYDPSTDNFNLYGGRGIVVCERWQSFPMFLLDMGTRPTPSHSIERIDNDGDYEPGNCRWATTKEQANNRRSNRFLEFDGQRLTLKQWSEKTGLGECTIAHRIDICGWDASDALRLAKGERR